MERLPDNIFLKYNPDTLVALRKVYNLDKPGQMDEAIDLLDAWVKKQNHFVKKDFSREYLERVIILLKGSVERAKAQLEKICTLRTLLPNYFEKFDAKNDFNILKGLATVAVFPKLTKENTRIYLNKYVPGKVSPTIFFHMYCYNVLMCEYLKANDYSNGIAIIVDVRDINIMDFVSQINLIELKQLCTIFLEGYDTRALNFFFLSKSKAIDVLIKIFRQMVSEKLGQRVHIFKEIEELHEYLPKDLLPSDYGGTEKSLDEMNDELVEELGSAANIEYFKQMSKVGTIEALRTSTKNNEDFSGIAGTFRTLSVD